MSSEAARDPADEALFAASGPLTRRIRVAVADDDPKMRSALAHVLGGDRTMQFVGAASDTAAVTRLVEDAGPAVVLMDVVMPGGGGAVATRAILARAPETRIVAFSAHADRASVLLMLEAGAVGYIEKGATASEIIQAVFDAAEGDSTLSSDVSTQVVDELAGRLRRDGAEERSRQERRERIKTLALSPFGLETVFQPIVDLQTGAVVAAEALTRFPRNPGRTPDQWFEEAECVGLGPALEAFAIRSAIKDIGLLPLEVALALNVSPQAITPALLDILMTVPPARLLLEVTEHEAVKDYDALVEAVAPLTSRGARLVVDDAGAGYAGLRHLLKLSPQMIKLDIELTRGLEIHAPTRALVSALLSFSSEIGATVVAEGIETASQLQAVRALGVPLGQGFLLGRPGPGPIASQIDIPRSTEAPPDLVSRERTHLDARVQVLKPIAVGPR